MHQCLSLVKLWFCFIILLCVTLKHMMGIHWLANAIIYRILVRGCAIKFWFMPFLSKTLHVIILPLHVIPLSPFLEYISILDISLCDKLVDIGQFIHMLKRILLCKLTYINGTLNTQTHTHTYIQVYMHDWRLLSSIVGKRLILQIYPLT